MSSYAVLGITSDATDDEVRLAYKHKALECHPDRHMDDKDVATRTFIELNAAYRAVLRERARKAAASPASSSSRPPAGQQDGVQEPTPPKASPASSDSSTRSFKSASSSSNSTPSSTPLSSPFTTPSSSPYSSPASSPVSSSTSLPDEEDSASTKTSVDEDDQSSTACSSTTNHTAKPPSDFGSPSGGAPSSPKPPRTKLRKQNPKKTQKSSVSSSSSSTSSHEYECRDSRSKPTYTPSTKSSSNNDHSNGQPKNRDHSSRRNTKYKATELKEYYNSFPSLKDFPKVDLDPEWTYLLPLTLEDIFHGKRVCYRIKRRYLTGKTKAVVLDVDVPAGCRAGTKIVFRDAGHERRDGMKQDLVFVVKEVKHERFVRGHEWAGDEGEGRGERKDEDRDKGRERRKDPDKDRDRDEKSSGQKPRKHRKYREDDLVMDVRLPWVDRLKEEKAKVVLSGVDGKELVFEIDCRSGKGSSGKEKDGKMTGVYILEDAGMPVRSNIRAGDGANKDAGAGRNGTGQRGRLIIRWEIFARSSPSSSKWDSFKQMLKFGK